jgi:DNA/RNA-binding domain of Phe-tRNA-synthetase-like protein
VSFIDAEIQMLGVFCKASQLYGWILTADMDLRLANRDEIFEPFGTKFIEHPNPFEIIFAEGYTVLTRHWTRRQSKHTLILPETTTVEINIDALPPVTDAEIESIFGEITN